MRHIKLRAFTVGAAVLATIAVGAGVGMGVASAASPNTSHFPTITGISIVNYSGNSENPTITITGKHFGAEPANQTPPGEAPGCGGPSILGTDYGNSLWIYDITGSWEAGWSQGVTGYGNCTGLNVTTWTNSKVVYTITLVGNPQNSQMNSGDTVALELKGAQLQIQVLS